MTEITSVIPVIVVNDSGTLCEDNERERQNSLGGWEAVGKAGGRSRDVLGRGGERTRGQGRRVQGLLVPTMLFIAL